jgi:hypothetical protein
MVKFPPIGTVGSGQILSTDFHAHPHFDILELFAGEQIVFHANFETFVAFDFNLEDLVGIAIGMIFFGPEEFFKRTPNVTPKASASLGHFSFCFSLDPDDDASDILDPAICLSVVQLLK